MAGKRKGKRFTHFVLYERERKTLYYLMLECTPPKNGSISVFHCFLYHEWLMTNISVSYLFVWFVFHFSQTIHEWCMPNCRAIMWFVTFFVFSLKNMSNFNMLFIPSIWLEFLFIYLFLCLIFLWQILLPTSLSIFYAYHLNFNGLVDWLWWHRGSSHR